MPTEDVAAVMAWYVPFLIALARIGDVAIGTLRTILMLAGYRYIAALLGVIEVALWVYAVGWALKWVTQGEITALIGYAGGFGAGVVIGMWLEGLVALGYRMVRIVSPVVWLEDGRASENGLVRVLREAGYRVTQVDGRGRDGKVEIVFTVVRRRYLEPLREIIAQHAPKAFVTIERVERPSGAGFGDTVVPKRLSALRQQVRK